MDLYFFAGGYCGVQPLEDGQVNACAMVQAAAANSMEQVLALHPRLAERSRAWQQVSETVATSPLVFAPPQAEEGGVLFAGDAAGFIDPFVGDGISLALRSGAMAAEALAEVWEGKRPVARRRRFIAASMSASCVRCSAMRDGCGGSRPCRARCAGR